MLSINCYKRLSPGSPFSVVGLSGTGREMGFDAMIEYTGAKSVWIHISCGQPVRYAGA
jgi:aldehyde dehydrogenase (NAD+)